MLSHLFNLPLPILEKIVRAVLVYFFLIALLRTFGKRELAQLTPFDLIVLLMLSNTVQNAIIGDDSTLTGGMIGAIALLAANYLTVRLVFHHPRLDRLFGGAATTLIQGGKLDHAALKKEVLTVRELRMAANRQGIEDLHEVERGTLEPNGAFSFEKRPVSAADLRYAELSAKIDELTLLLKTK
ncbi:MAG: YetF domain-containing protein [Acidobacteriota bacterium]